MKSWPLLASLLVTTAVCVVTTQVHAEKFLLQNGETVEGAIVRSVGKTLSIKLPEHGMRQLPISEVDHVEITLRSGERIIGELMGWSNRRYEIQVPDRLLNVKDGNVILDVAVEVAPTVQTEWKEGTSGPNIAPLPESGNEESLHEDPGAEASDIVAVIPILTGSSTPIDENGIEAIFRLRLSEATSKPVAVIYSVVDGAAKNGSDYQDTAGVASIDPGKLSVDISIPIINDDLAEPDEEFELFISVDPKTATLGRRSIKTIIRDDDS
ncbi:MAG: Calx-beta domain-containing protein [Geminicoccaceae bacterium]